MAANDKLVEPHEPKPRERLGLRDQTDGIDRPRAERRQAGHHRGGDTPFGSNEPYSDAALGHT